MAKERVSIPKSTKESLLKEYNHRCSICGIHNPHIHHIDENPSNNDLENLIPLCPNCHLIDQHNPTSNISPNKLKLFRKYKDPTILSDEFEPLFRRMNFLYDIENGSIELSSSVKELIEFVASLKMGDFYSKRIKELIGQSLSGIFTINLHGPDYEFDEQVRKSNMNNIKTLVKNREQVYFLCVELLRYQDWRYKSKNS